MQVRIALIALATALSLPVWAGPPHLTSILKVQRQPAQARTVVPAPVVASEMVDGAGFLDVGGEEGYRFVGTGRESTRVQVLQQQADSAAAVGREGWLLVGGEEGALYLPQPATVTRATVQHDALHARHMPSAVDGWLVVGGEVGAVFTGDVDPKDALRAYAPGGYLIDGMRMPDGTPCMMAG